MTASVNLVPASTAQPTSGVANATSPAQNEEAELGIRFEKMLWAEMLRHAGLEKAMTRTGGQAASAFAQFMVEAIAEDIARKSPLGLDPAGQLANQAYAANSREG
ncbi:MAG: hypothetical protein VX593_07905 [Pseudomonadota bacterium]|nr:hypothetical protein [Pseudomonadota bacterium]